MERVNREVRYSYYPCCLLLGESRRSNFYHLENPCEFFYEIFVQQF